MARGARRSLVPEMQKLGARQRSLPGLHELCCSRRTNTSKAKGSSRAKCSARAMVRYLSGSSKTRDTNNFNLLQKFVQKPQQLFCNLCQSVGHDECNCDSYELMIDRTPTYRMQVETRPPDQGVGGARGEYQGRKWGRGGGGPGRDWGQVICYNCGGPGHYARHCLNLTHLSCRY